MKKYKSFLTSIKEVYSKENQGTYRSLNTEAKAVLLRKAETGVSSQPEKFTSGLADMPITNTVEVDPSDQIVAGSYRTKHFEMNPQAQYLFANIPRDPRMDYGMLEKLAIEMDKLFGIHKRAATNDHATEQEKADADEMGRKIYHMARGLNLHNSVGFIDDTLRLITGLAKRGENLPADHVRKSMPVVMTKERPDKDVDNSVFALSRASKAQKKLKIIDDD